MPTAIDRFTLTPENTCLETLSPSEINALFVESHESIHSLMERCALAVLNCGSNDDDVRALLEKYHDFSLEVIRTSGGIELLLKNPPESAFVSYQQVKDGRLFLTYKIIEGIRQHIFALLRDLVFIKTEIERTRKFDLETPKGITDTVFLILRNARIFQKTGRHKIIVCWGGHAISKEEYDYSRSVGYQCGLRLMDVITGCGPGAMRAPMEGATLAHANQRIKDGRYIGITEPGIIASEAPNPIVDPLVIMPDIEKRLEAFVRLGHGIIIFPGGVGTAEELMYLLGILSHPDNLEIPLPIILTGPKSSEDYFEALRLLLDSIFGEQMSKRYIAIYDDPEKVAQEINRGLLDVKAIREKNGDSYYFNRTIHIPFLFQERFVPTHENVRSLEINRRQEKYVFAANLRRVFSAIVSGNVKPEVIKSIKESGPFEIRGEQQFMSEIDSFLASLVKQGRMFMKRDYEPCYRIVS